MSENTLTTRSEANDRLYHAAIKAGCKPLWCDGIAGWSRHCGCANLRHACDYQCSAITRQSLKTGPSDKMLELVQKPAKSTHREHASVLDNAGVDTAIPQTLQTYVIPHHDGRQTHVELPAASLDPWKQCERLKAALREIGNIIGAPTSPIHREAVAALHERVQKVARIVQVGLGLVPPEAPSIKPSVRHSYGESPIAKVWQVIKQAELTQADNATLAMADDIRLREWVVRDLRRAVIIACILRQQEGPETEPIKAGLPPPAKSKSRQDKHGRKTRKPGPKHTRTSKRHIPRTCTAT